MDTEAEDYLPYDWYPLYSDFSVKGYDDYIITITHQDPEFLETDDLNDAEVYIYWNRTRQ